MQADELITRALKRIDNIPDPTNGAHASKRERYLEIIQECVNQLYLDPHGFSWTKKDGSVSISLGASSGLLPTDFKEVGKEGTVWGPGSPDEPMDSIPVYMVRKIQESESPTSLPEVYAISGIDPTTKQQLIQVPVAAGAYTLTLKDYKKQAPTIVDASSGSNLDEVPADYHLGVIFPYMRFQGYEGRGDKRADKWEVRYLAALTLARQNDLAGKPTVQQMIGFIDDEGEGGMW